MVTTLWRQINIIEMRMTYWLTWCTRRPPRPHKTPRALKTKHSRVKSRSGDELKDVQLNFLKPRVLQRGRLRTLINTITMAKVTTFIIIAIIIITTQTARLGVLRAWSCFLSASLFVGWPSHLFHSHICDLLGGDWYGNIIIPPWIWSLFSLTLALSLPSISLITFATSTFLCRSCLSPPLCCSGSFPQPAPLLPYFNSPFMTCRTTLHFFLHWPILLKERSCAEQQWNLLRERWKASRIQSNSPRRQDTQWLVYTLSIKCFTCHQPQMLSVVFFLGFQIYTVYWIISFT